MTNFSEIKKLLSRDLSSDESRKIIVFAGDDAWLADVLPEILVGLDHEAGCLWVSDRETPLITSDLEHSSFKHAHHWLGGEKHLVVFDADDAFDVDAFAAISGIVVGGGLFIILMPGRDKWSEVYASLFGQRLLQHLHAEPGIHIVDQYAAMPDLNLAEDHPVRLQDCEAPFLTRDQQQAVETIEEQVLNLSHNPVVIISDRGRGKSAALGLATARLLKAGIKNIAITAPRLRATDIIFKHVAELLPDAEITRGCVKWQQAQVQFYPPDQLVHSSIEADVLLVDEAAAIPVPLLTSFLQHFSQCVFATTVHGYEGTGRGFALRFNKVLTQQYPQWIKLQMQTPVRWSENDLLEKWMFDLLCLDAEIPEGSAFTQVDKNHLEYRELSQVELAKNEQLLREIFSLLVLAHYRTRPSDLKKCLDDTALTIYVALDNKHVIAVALVIREGSFTEDLSSAVYRGERRPQGHLLAQALTYHCGIEDAATLDYARVMRIAVHPEFQQQGIGSTLLQFVIDSEKQHGRDAIGTSFGMNNVLLDFWRHSQFDVVRIGFTREQTSGEHAAIMLLPLSSRGREAHHEAVIRFCQQLPFWVTDVLRDLTDTIKKSFSCPAASFELSEYEIKDLQSFVSTSRNYELCISALNKLVQQAQHCLSQEDFPEPFCLLIEAKVRQKKSWDEIANELGFTGKDDARMQFHQAIVYLVKTSQVDGISTRFSESP